MDYGAGYAGYNATDVQTAADPNKIKHTMMCLYLDKTSPTLKFQVPEQTSYDTNQPYVITTNFPIQTWTYITVSVDSQYVDFYLNGKLIKSIQMKNPPQTPPATTNPVKLGMFDAMVAGFSRSASPSSPQDVWNAYLVGNGSSTKMSSYNVNVDFIKDNSLQSTYNIV